jgi:predicted Ser/Thr protein kinase
MSEAERARGSSSLVGLVIGRYLLERQLGEGGMGVVYAARHQDLGKAAAVKVLHERRDQLEQARLRFLREGQAASRIRHPNIVDVYDVGNEAGRDYLVMELLQGESLGSLLERERPLAPQRIADLLVPVVSALAAAHEVGIVHRDVKPDNIFLSSERNLIVPKVLDFGISKLSHPENAASLTGTGTLLGTPHYMSPEQAQTDKNIDARSDQYSIGVILYQCATGRVPIEGRSLYDLIPRIVQGDFTAPRQLNPSLPAAFERLILRAMARNPNDRLSSTRALGHALLPFASERVRANHAEELTDEARPSPLLPVESQAVSELGTTLADVVQEREGRQERTPRRAVTLRWAGGVVVLGGALIAAWQLSKPGRAPSAAVAVASAPLAPSATAVEAPPASTPSPMPEARSSKRLSSEPAGASVWVGGKNVGQTPLELEVVAGSLIEVELRHPGFLPETRRLTESDPEIVTIRLNEAKAKVKASAPKKQVTAGRPELAPR